VEKRTDRSCTPILLVIAEEVSKRQIRNTATAAYEPLLHGGFLSEGVNVSEHAHLFNAHTKPRGLPLRLRGVLIHIYIYGEIIATGHGLDVRGSISGSGKTFSSIPQRPGRGVKRPGREAGHSPPSSAEVKNGGAIPPFPHMSSDTTLPYVIMCKGKKVR
jgi:hypothetical protein